MGLLSALIFIAACILLVPVAVFVIECLAALLPQSRDEWDPNGPAPQTVILVPAHNEEAGLGATLESLKAACTKDTSILVVADNCTDNTADVARASGAECIERTDPDRRGKGYALVYGLDHMASAPPDVVIVVDADCRVSPDALKLLAQKADATDRPIQADYVLKPPEEHTALSMVSGLAVLVKNRVRPLGLRRLGLPCHLTGSGMAFPYDVLRKAPPTGSYLVEDMLIGIELARLGHPPLSCFEAQVASDLPEQDEAAEGQRRRWEHGHLTTLLQKGPPLVVEGLQTRSIALVAMGLDLLVPPMAFLVIMIGVGLVVSLFAGIIGAGYQPFMMLFSGLGWVILAVATSWYFFGRDTLPAKYLATIPAYVAWKVPLYLQFIQKKGQSTWERTQRAFERPGSTAKADDGSEAPKVDGEAEAFDTPKAETSDTPKAETSDTPKAETPDTPKADGPHPAADVPAEAQRILDGETQGTVSEGEPSKRSPVEAHGAEAPESGSPSDAPAPPAGGEDIKPSATPPDQTAR